MKYIKMETTVEGAQTKLRGVMFDDLNTLEPLDVFIVNDACCVEHGLSDVIKRVAIKHGGGLLQVLDSNYDPIQDVFIYASRVHVIRDADDRDYNVMMMMELGRKLNETPASRVKLVMQAEEAKEAGMTIKEAFTYLTESRRAAKQAAESGVTLH